MGAAGGQNRTYTQNSHNVFSPQIPSSPTAVYPLLRSEHSQGYGGDNGQSDNRVAGAVDLGNFEAFAEIPALIK